MATDWKTQMTEILKSNGNDQCADCNAKDPDWGVHNIGVFVCINCAGIHRQMGVHISKVRSAKYDEWTDTQLQFIRSKGNSNVNRTLAGAAPIYQMSPANSESSVIREFFIRSKYERKEFLCSEEMKENPAQLDQPDRLKIVMFLQENSKKKVFLQLLGEYLHYFRSGHDSFSFEKYSVKKLRVTVEGSNNGQLVLHVDTINNDSLFRVRSPNNDINQLVDWAHAIRRSSHFYSTAGVVSPRKSIAARQKPLQILSVQDVQNGTQLGTAHKKGGGARGYKRRWWVLLNGFLYYFKNNFLEGKKPKSEERPQGYISLLEADLILDNSRIRANKNGVVLIATQERTFYVQPEEKTRDHFMTEVEKACLRLWPRALVDFSMLNNVYNADVDK